MTFTTIKTALALLALLTIGGTACAQSAAPVAGQPLSVRPAAQSTAAVLAPMLGATRAGKRIVAVGDFGIVLLSDDDGKSFRQAAGVPVSTTLTAVSFADDKHGWAVGHWGVILHSEDGGENWKIQRSDTGEDRPLFSVHFFDAREGIAVGLWSLVLKTRDGGKSWEALTMPAPPEGGRGDRNLFRIFASPQGSLFVAAERGAVLRSDDRGQSWRYLNTGYNGSFWAGIALADGTLAVAGLRGTLYRSSDDGRTWQNVPTGSKSSLTDLVAVGNKLIGVGLDGVQIESSDRGASFAWTQRDDRLSMTAAVAAGSDGLVRFSKRGVVKPGPTHN
ncbi:MAG: glycosyl hydrolase [Dechloromonas sp.]|nr:MAG: glycosyl hydrolase [Dechloromonas sp.]